MKKRGRVLLLSCLAAAGLWMISPLPASAQESIPAAEDSEDEINREAKEAGDSADKVSHEAGNTGDFAGESSEEAEEKADIAVESSTEAEDGAVFAGMSSSEDSEAGDEDAQSDALSEDIEDLTEALLAELDLNSVDDILAGNALTRDTSFSEIVRSILDTDAEISAWDVWNEIRPLIFADAAEYKSILVRILVLTIAFAFLHNFIDVFENSQISRTGFYLFFLVLMVLLTRSYLIVSGMFAEVMSQIVAVMEAVIPAFSMTLVFASAQTTAAAFYQIAVGVIWLVE